MTPTIPAGAVEHYAQDDQVCLKTEGRHTNIILWCHFQHGIDLQLQASNITQLRIRIRPEFLVSYNTDIGMHCIVQPPGR